MPLLPDALVAAVPRSWTTGLLLAAAALATVGSVLVLAATVFGAWLPAFGAAVAFLGAGVLWHLADAGH